LIDAAFGAANNFIAVVFGGGAGGYCWLLVVWRMVAVVVATSPFAFAL